MAAGRVIVVMAEEGGDVLWDRTPQRGRGGITAESLGLDADLTDRLNAWGRDYIAWQWDDPPLLPSPDQQLQHRLRGLVLAHELQAALGSDFYVRFQ